MASPKGDQQEEGNAVPPTYAEASSQAGSSRSASHAQAAATDSKRPYTGPQDAAEEGAARPTVDSPFSFPPAYVADASHAHTTSGSISTSNTPSSSSYTFLLAIPQTTSQPTSAFLAAYNAPLLLRHGIGSATFTSFLSTLSAFLSATVSARALSHAAGIISDVPRKFSQDTVAHIKEVGRHIGSSARKGHFLAAGVGALAGTVTIPVAAALRLAGAPAAAVGGLAKKPLSPRERADAYVTVAQKDWFGARGLTVQLVDTAELLLLHAQRRGVGCGSSGGGDDGNEVAVKDLVDLVHRIRERGPDAQLEALQREFGFAPLEVIDEQAKAKPLDIGAKTLWLAITDAANES